jgi:hypothetical protein
MTALKTIQEKAISCLMLVSTGQLAQKDMDSPQEIKDYPMAALYMFYGGDKRRTAGDIQLIPMTQAITSLPDILNWQL